MAGRRARSTKSGTSTKVEGPPRPPAGRFALLALKLFAELFSAPSWLAWSVWLKAVFGLSMSEAEHQVFQQCTGRLAPPTSPCREVWTVVGRRSGKSRLAAFIAVCLAVLKTYTLAPGEKPLIVVIAPARYQTDIIIGYVRAFLRIIGVEITRDTEADGIELANGVSIRPQVASFKTVRGFTIVGAVLDEVAFFTTDDSADPDTEILRAIRPSLDSVPGSLLVCISSPYATRGELFKTHEKHFAKNTDVLVWQAATRTMNPTFAQGAVDRAMEEDPESAQAEYLGLFRSDLEDLWSRQAIKAVVITGRYEIAPMTGTACVAFVDPAGGAGGGDSFTLGIAYKGATGQPILAMVREVRPPFSPEGVCKQFAADIKRYGCRAVFSDAYAAQWPVEQFAKHNITVMPSPLTKSELYLEMVPMVNSGGCELLDNTRLIDQLAGLERRTGRSGKDSVDHRPGAKDDLANAACGALIMCVQQVGLLAPMPEDFTECINPTMADRCALLGSGPWLPNSGHCRAHCPGALAILPVWRQYQQQMQQAGEDSRMLSTAQFIRERFERPVFYYRTHAYHLEQKRIEDALGV